MKKLIIFFLTLVVSSSIWAGNTGKLTGKIVDAKTNEPLPFVNVTIVGTMLGAASDIDGNYTILNIAPGTYSVKFQYVGYQTKVVEGVRISIDLTTHINVKLSEESVAMQEVVVQADRKGLQKDVTSSQALVSSDDIKNLPVAELSEVLQLQAGVTKGAGGDFHIRGGRSSEIAYNVNGISITDSYDNSQGIQLDNSSVQELQVISGTFNAEYGNAMSGIINTVTKEGGTNFQGSFETYGGDYVSNHTNIFWNIDALNPIANFRASLGGPFLTEKIRFFINGRYNYSDGYLYGKRIFTTTGAPGDSVYVPMNYHKRFMGLGNLSFYASKKIKLNLEALYSKDNFKDYNHGFKLEPDGDVKKYSSSLSSTFTFTNTMSSESFYTFKLSYFNRNFQEHLYDNPLDPRYLSPDSLNTVGYAFIHAGTNLHRFERDTRTYLTKFDYTSQVSEHHMVKFGFEGKLDNLAFDDYYLEPLKIDNVPVSPFRPAIPDPTSLARQKYNANPLSASAYIQDKIEYEQVIINIGVRFDYFNSRGKILVDRSDPNIYTPLRAGLDTLTVSQREPYFYKDASPKWQLAPRVGVAYPISDVGVFHFSYGQFFQVPTYNRLFDRGDYKVPTTGSTGAPFGNPDLNPQRTTMYEIGFRQSFMDDFLIDATLFYRDIRDYVTAGPMIETRNGVGYSIYTNRDYANVKGITFYFSKKYSNNFSFDINYTYQFAEGSASTPEEDFYAQRSNSEPTLYLLPLDWDQRHLLNASFYYGVENWGASLLSRFGTGLPYTPSVTQYTADRGLTSGFSKNSRRRPNQFQLDLKAHYNFNVFGKTLTAFVRVFNILDSKIVVNVFSDTGKPDFTTEAESLRGVRDPNRPNTIEEYLTRPWNYAQPRLVQVGFNYNF